MKKYTVRMEFTTTSAEFADVELSARTPEEAKLKSIAMYNNDEFPDVNFYAGEDLETTLDTNYIDNWDVIEKTNE